MSDETVIRVLCPNLNCQRVLAVPHEARGKLVRCRMCGMTVLIPPPQIAEEAKAPEAA